MAKPHGLRNNGNTCYFNATLQNLYRTIVFRRNLINILGRQKTHACVVNESISSESSFLAKVFCNVKKLLHNVQNGELNKCFFLIFASLALYKAGSSGALMSTARWILIQPQLIKSTVQKLSSICYVDHVSNCSVITCQEFLPICPRNVHLVVSDSEWPWFAVISLALSVCLFFYKRNLLGNVIGEVLSRFSGCGVKLSSSEIDWWPEGNKVILCSAALSFCACHLMASSQPIYKWLVEGNPGTLFELFIMASSTNFLFYHLGAAEVLRNLFRVVHLQPEEPVGVALARLFRNIDSESEGCHNPRAVLEAVCRRSKRFCGFRQQDSHELLRHLLDGIREEERSLKKEKTNFLTLVDRVFGGHFKTVYTCEKCASPYCLYEAFLDISLPITLHEDTLKEISDTDNKERNYFSQQHSIEFWMKVFSRSENLGQQYLCSVCNVSSTGDDYILTCGKKQTLICDPPAILCIHVKRFRKTADDFVKANDHVEFSEYLDLKPYLTNDCRRLAEDNEKVVYALFGVVVHSGSLKGGHYTAYIKSAAGGGQEITGGNIEEFLQKEGFDWDSLPTGGIDSLQTESQHIPRNSPNLSQTHEWYYCSDSTIECVGADEVFRQAAYLLFYERLC